MDVPLLMAVKAGILPDPEAASPIALLLFVQEYHAPETFEEKAGIETIFEAQ